jgi:hypothetical protein
MEPRGKAGSSLLRNIDTGASYNGVYVKRIFGERSQAPVQVPGTPTRTSDFSPLTTPLHDGPCVEAGLVSPQKAHDGGLGANERPSILPNWNLYCSALRRR